MKGGTTNRLREGGERQRCVRYVKGRFGEGFRCVWRGCGILLGDVVEFFFDLVFRTSSSGADGTNNRERPEWDVVVLKDQQWTHPVPLSTIVRSQTSVSSGFMRPCRESCVRTLLASLESANKSDIPAPDIRGVLQPRLVGYESLASVSVRLPILSSRYPIPIHWHQLNDPTHNPKRMTTERGSGGKRTSR